LTRARLRHWCLLGFDGAHFVDLVELRDHVALGLVGFLEAIQQLSFVLLQLFGELLRAEGVIMPLLHSIHVALVEAHEVALVRLVEVRFCSLLLILNTLECSLFFLQKCIPVAQAGVVDFLLLALER